MDKPTETTVIRAPFLVRGLCRSNVLKITRGLKSGSLGSSKAEPRSNNVVDCRFCVLVSLPANIMGVLPLV